MVERRINNFVNKCFTNKWVKGGLRLAVAAAITAASFIPEANTSQVRSEVGSLTTEPILLVFDPSQTQDMLQYKPWNLGRVWPGVDISPEFFVKALDKKNKIPPKLLLTTTIETDGLGCVYDYPDPTTCYEVSEREPNISYYLFDTSVLDPGRIYGEIGSARLRPFDKPGTFTITMELTDETARGLVASESTALDVPRIYREYVPYALKAGSFSLN